MIFFTLKNIISQWIIIKDISVWMIYIYSYRKYDGVSPTG